KARPCRRRRRRRAREAGSCGRPIPPRRASRRRAPPGTPTATAGGAEPRRGKRRPSAPTDSGLQKPLPSLYHPLTEVGLDEQTARGVPAFGGEREWLRDAHHTARTVLY